MLFAALSALSLASVVAAQQTVQVGSTVSAQGGVFQFIPPSITAKNGTVVTFKFSGIPGNHSVTQSSFADPCDPLAGGFDSGFVYIPTSETEIPEFNITITDDSKPIWFYCKQLKPTAHCIDGMVGAINAPSTGNTFASFQSAAKAFTGTPGQGLGHLVGVGASASAPVGPIPSGVTTFGSPAASSATASATGTASGSAAATGSGSATATSASGSSASATASSAASHVAASPIVAFLAAVLGLVMV